MKYVFQAMRLVTTDGIIATGLVAALLLSVILGADSAETPKLIITGLIGYMGQVVTVNKKKDADAQKEPETNQTD